jgi:hypothetical protein
MHNITIGFDFDIDMEQKLIIFESVFQDDGMKKLFYKFLNKEANTDTFDFIIEYQDFVKISDTNEQKEKLLLIYNTYIKEKSKKELNLSSFDKKQAQNVFLKDDYDISKALELLNNISISMQKELRFDK